MKGVDGATHGNTSAIEGRQAQTIAPKGKRPPRVRVFAERGGRPRVREGAGGRLDRSDGGNGEGAHRVNSGSLRTGPVTGFGTKARVARCGQVSALLECSAAPTSIRKPCQNRQARARTPRSMSAALLEAAVPTLVTANRHAGDKRRSSSAHSRVGSIAPVPPHFRAPLQEPETRPGPRTPRRANWCDAGRSRCALLRKRGAARGRRLHEIDSGHRTVGDPLDGGRDLNRGHGIAVLHAGDERGIPTNLAGKPGCGLPVRSEPVRELHASKCMPLHYACQARLCMCGRSAALGMSDTTPCLQSPSPSAPVDPTSSGSGESIADIRSHQSGRRLEWTETNLGRIEKGEVPYSQDLLETLAEFYDCEISDFTYSRSNRP